MGEDLRRNTGRSPDYRDGYTRALRDCINWLHKRADEMNDPHAKQVLNSAGFSLGNAAKEISEKVDG